MDCKNYNIKLVEGNAFALLFPLKTRTFVSREPIDEDIDILALTDIVVKVGGVVYPAEQLPEGLVIRDDGTLARGTYNIDITATYYDNAIHAAYFEALTIVAFNEQSDAQQYIQGSPIVLPAAYCVYSLTDAELEALKEEYREKNAQLDQAIADADEAKREWEQKAADLDGVAQEQTLTDGVTAIRDDISHIDIDTSDLAKETSVKDGNDTAIGVSKEIRSEVGTSSDTAAETGTLFAVVKWIKNKVNAITGYALQGTDATATNTAIKQAILDNAGVPTLTIPDSTAAQELAPNTLYIFASRTSTLTLTLGTPIVGIANEYHFFVETDATAPTINFPAGISWNGGSAPTIAANKTYEVSILNNVAAYFEV